MGIISNIYIPNIILDINKWKHLSSKLCIKLYNILSLSDSDTVSSYLTISRVSLMHTRKTRRPIQSYPISLTQTVNNAYRWCGFKDVYAQHGNADRRLDGAHPRGGMPRVLLRRHTCVNYDAGMRLVMPAWHATGAPHGTQQQEARIKLINRDERKYGIGLTRKRFCAPPPVESRSIANNFANFAMKLMEIHGNSSFRGGRFLIYLFGRYYLKN